MRKRILAMLMAGMMVFTVAPADVFAAAPAEQAEEVPGDLEKQPEEEALTKTDLENPEEEAFPGTEQKDPEQEAVGPEDGMETGNTETPEEADIPEETSDIPEETSDIPEETSDMPQEAVNKEKADPETENKQEAEGTPKVQTGNQEQKAPKDLENETAPEEESLANRILPAGGLERPREIQLSEEAAQNMDVQYGLEDGIPAEGSQKYDSSWDIYSSNYIYNRLNAADRKFWDTLDFVCRKYLTTKADAAVWDSETSYSREAISYQAMGLTKERAIEILLMFSYSNPQYYFLDSGYMLGTYAGTAIMAPTFYSAFTTGAGRASYTAQVKSRINSWVSKVSKGSTEVQKAQIAHDLIINKVAYETGYPNVFKTPYHQSAFSVFCKDYTVCAGYTKAFSILMNGAGVDTIGVTSKEHAWNKICINDSWYNIDLTWDDLDGYGGKQGYYMYFNRSDAMITGEYLEQGTSYHQMEAMYAGKVPKCTQDSGITADNPFSTGTYKKPTATVKTPVISLDKSNKKNIKVTIKTESGADIYYTTDGMNPSSSYSRSYRYTKPFTISSNVNLKVIAVKNTKKDSKIVSKKVYGRVHTVKFNSMKGSRVSSQKVYYGDKLKKPSNPKRSGYVFAGWYKDSKYKSAWNLNSKVTKNMTLYAKWAKKCTVKFNANKGAVKTKSKSVGYKEKYGTLPKASRSGYSFSGWYTKKSGGKKITENSRVTTAKTTTLYAQWKKVTVSKAAISKVTNASGLKMTVAIKKVSGAKGYQIRYSTKSSMKSAKTISTGSTKKTIAKLSKGKKYYVQVRAYKTDSKGKKITGAWSAKKSVVIKK